MKCFLLAAALGLWASPATAHHISGNVVCTDTPPQLLGGVTVTIQGTTTGTFTTTTRFDGFFIQSLPTVTDTYTVTITPPAGLTVTSPASGKYVVNIFANGVGGPDSFEEANFGLTGCGTPTCTGKIGDFVWADLNGNGCQDANEPGIAGVKVDLYAGCAPNLTFVTSTFTASDGKYLFNGLCAGQYTVGFNTPAGFTPTLANQSCNVGGKPADETDSDCDCAGGTPCGICVNLATDNSQDLTIDCGYIPTCPACVDPALGLGAAAGMTVLQLSNHKVSITGPAGGIVGDIGIAPNGSLSMSGDEYVTGVVKLGPGAKISNSSHSTVNVLQNVDLSAAIAAAYAANINAANQPCSQSYAKLDGKTVTTINGGVGINVICVGEISLSGKQISLNGPVGAKFIINITGKLSLTGGGAGPQIRTTGGVQPKDVLYNLIGTGQDVAFSGGGGGEDCCAAIVDGTLLAPYRKINLAPGLVNGQIISGLDISIVSGSSVRCPPCPVLPPN